MTRLACGQQWLWRGLGITGLLLACQERDLSMLEDRSLVAISGVPAGDGSDADASAPRNVCGPDASEGEACVPVRIDECGPACGVLSREPSLCGDGRVSPPEECDDGNTQNLDGCSEACRGEVCGNGRVDPGELCDRLDVSCDQTCQIDSAGGNACGNGSTDLAEGCDDGNTSGGDGCSRVCGLEYCGDDEVNQPPGEEQCEPPGSDVCDDTCQLIECGDGGPAQGREQCDDGNVEPGDGCDGDCRVEACGDGKLDVGEDCEPPGEGLCSTDCSAEHVECGDGKVDDAAFEECDHGDIAYGDGCSPTCLLEQCGNGRIEPPFETCEPPATTACGHLCRSPVCGDGWLDAAAGEECEDGNLHAGDGCGVSCRLEGCGNGQLEIGEHCEPPGTGGCGPSCEFVASGEALTTPLPIAARAFSPDETGVAGTRLSAWGDERVSRAWCVRTAPGARYRWRVTASLLEPDGAPVSAALGARFFGEPDCSDGMLGGFSTTYPIAWSAGSESLFLPPASPVPGDPGFDAPPGAVSMQLWVGVQGPPAPATLRLEDVELVHLGPERCGDGIPEGGEQCEPDVTPECDSACELPVACGDGWAAPGECGSGDCPSDCGLEPPVCGDGVAVAPEECDPVDAAGCRENCTFERTFCGDGRVEGDESCDPPDGAHCDETCQAIECGNGAVEAPEECEPPGSDGCSQHCRALSNQESTCGDRLLQGVEACDPPNPDTWCSLRCQRLDPRLSCGDGWVDRDADEECDPPGVSEDCGLDCKIAVCGDGEVGGRELCDPPDGEACSDECQPLGDALDCQLCLSDQCGGDSDDDLFRACFGLQGVAKGGPAEGEGLRRLCIDAVECMRQTGCAAESRDAFGPAPTACFCGKSVLTPEGNGRLRACRDGVTPPEGACRVAFERAAQSEQPSAVLAALDPEFSSGPLAAAVRLMSECGHDDQRCGEACSIESQCGNGVLETGELCDPGLDEHCVGGICAILPCGNGVVDVEWPYGADSEDPELRDYAQPDDWLAETCDIADPYTNQGDRCDNTCQLVVTCGDGTLVPSVEACDPGDDGDWSECCRPDDAAQLASCDRNGNQRLDRNEQCQAPSVCGNGRREGTEECDPAVSDPARCVDCRAVDPCTECTRRECPSHHDFCYGGAVEPRTRIGCGEVLDCIAASGCAREGDYQTCRCGTSDLASCAQLGGDGPCEDIIAQNTLCPTNGGEVDEVCVTSSALVTTVPTGAALQIVLCRKFYCPTECDYRPYDTGVEE